MTTRPTTFSRTQALRSMLESQRERLAQAARTTRHAVRDDADDDAGVVADIAEQSDADMRADVDLALLALRTEMVQEIDRALGQLDEGTYGRCIDCGAGIAPNRLTALPAAGRCRYCEEAREAVGERKAPTSTRWLS